MDTIKVEFHGLHAQCALDDFTKLQDYYRPMHEAELVSRRNGVIYALDNAKVHGIDQKRLDMLVANGDVITAMLRVRRSFWVNGSLTTDLSHGELAAAFLNKAASLKASPILERTSNFDWWRAGREAAFLDAADILAHTGQYAEFNWTTRQALTDRGHLHG